MAGRTHHRMPLTDQDSGTYMGGIIMDSVKLSFGEEEHRFPVVVGTEGEVGIDISKNKPRFLTRGG